MQVRVEHHNPMARHGKTGRAFVHGMIEVVVVAQHHP